MTDDELERWTSERLAAVRRDLARMTGTALHIYAGAVAAQIVIACADAGATDWPANLHLADVVEKHLMRTVVTPDVDGLVKALRGMTEEERMVVFGNFCRYCGRDDPRCQCENDE